jgi:FixJ family two-component response regulator
MGASDFILKPIQRQRLLDRVRLAITRGQGEVAE